MPWFDEIKPSFRRLVEPKHQEMKVPVNWNHIFHGFVDLFVWFVWNACLSAGLICLFWLELKLEMKWFDECSHNVNDFTISRASFHLMCFNPSSSSILNIKYFFGQFSQNIWTIILHVDMKSVTNIIRVFDLHNIKMIQKLGIMFGSGISNGIENIVFGWDLVT